MVASAHLRHGMDRRAYAAYGLGQSSLRLPVCTLPKRNLQLDLGS
jgi:hypothetical protein